MAGYSNNEADYDALNKIISNSTYTSTVINGTDVSYKEDDVENVDFDEISNTASNSVYTNSTGYSVEVKGDSEERAAKYEVNEQLNDLADFNGDGTFDYEDIKAMNDSLRSNTTDYGLTIGADMNGDLIFDEKDIQILTDYYNGKTSGKAFDVEYLKYKNSVLKSGYAKSHNVESLLTNFAIDHTSDVNALIDDYFISKTDFNNDGKIDQNDYVYAMTHKSEGLDKYSDLNGDGVFDDKDINILKTYLDGGDVTQSLNVNQVLMFSCKQDLKDYEAREKEYVDYIEYLESVDASKELINTIKSKKDAIQETMRAIKRRYSDLEKKDNYAFQHYERDMGVYWQKDIDYDKVADYYEEHKNLLNCPELQGKDVDIITVIDYITRERGIPIEYFEAEAPGAPGNGWYWYYDLMSENERKAFQYQYRYNGKSAAMNYFNDLKTELDKRQEGKGAGYNKNKSWARNNKENESDPNYLSKMYKKHQSLIKRIIDLSDEQKKYYHFILDTEGEQAAYDYLENADYSQALNPEYQKNSISTINQTDYVKEYLLTKVDLNNDGKIDQNDYVYATTHRSSGLDKYSDLNGDGKFDDKDLNILKSYLDGKDVSASLDGQSFMKNTYELQNKEYDEKIAGLVKQQEKLKKLIEKLSSGDDYESSEIDDVEVSFTKEEAQKMLDQVSTEISQLKMLIKDNKQMILELPYFNMMMTPEYQEFASNYDCKNINNIDYEQLLYDYEHQGSNGQLGHTYETEDNPVDWFAVIEYLVEEKGLSISEMGAFNTTYIDYMSMDESQRMMYHYLFKTKGKEEASHYFNDIIKDPRRQREAKFRVDRKIKEMDCTYSVDENGNIVDVKLDSSFRNLVSTFGEGMDDAITGNYAGIFKWGEDGYTEEEYEKMYLMQYLAKNDTLNSSYGAGQVGGGVATAAMTTIAFAGTSVLTGGTAAAAWAPYLVNVVSIGTAVANQGGEANHYALLNGNSQEAANQYAFQIMKNSIFRQACSSVVGKGIGSSAQFLSLLRGGNSLGFLGNIAVSSANNLADASTSVWEKAQEQNLKEALLNEAPLDADSANSQLLEVFMSNVAMGALQQLPTAALSYYRFKKGGETFEFSADDWLSYKKSNPEATAEDFFNSYSGSHVIDPESGKTIKIDYDDKGVKQAHYRDVEVANNTLKSIRESGYNSEVENSIKHLSDINDADSIEYIMNNIENSGDIMKILNYLSSNNKTGIINQLILPDKLNTSYMTHITESLLAPTLDYYQKAAVYAGSGNAENFKTYRAHTEEHVKEVAQKSMEAVDSIKKALQKNPVEGFSDNVNAYECYIAALWHDVGMGAGQEGIIGYDSVYENGNVITKVLVDNKGGNVVRSNHSFNSAMNVLANSSQIADLGVDPNKVALLAFAHSKSNSGVGTVNSAKDWSLCIDKINSAVQYHNEHNPNSPIRFSNTGGTNFIDSLVKSGILVDNSTKKTVSTTKKGKVYHNEYNINPEKLGELASGTYAIRLGDANTNNNNIGTNQAGEKIDMSTLQRNGKTSFDTSMGFGEVIDLVDSEAAGSTIMIGNDKVTLDKYGAGFVLGEANVDFSSGLSNERSLVETFTVNDPTEYPACTVFNIDERLGEVATAEKGKFKTKIEIQLPKNKVPQSSRQQIENYYKAFAISRGIDPSNVVWI